MRQGGNQKPVGLKEARDTCMIVPCSLRVDSSAVDGDSGFEKESGGWCHHAQKSDPFFALGRPCIIRLLYNPVACPRGSLIRGMGRHFMCGSTVCIIS